MSVRKKHAMNGGILDVLRKTVIMNNVQVSTPHGDFGIQVFGKITDATVRRIVKSTVKYRADGDSITDEDMDIINNNFMVKSYTSHAIMYECNVFDFLEIATKYKQIN